MFCRELIKCYPYLPRLLHNACFVHIVRQYTTRAATSSAHVNQVEDQSNAEAKIRIFDAHFLRDACSCSLCVGTSTGQKSFSTAHLSPLTKISNVESNSNFKQESFKVTWKPDGHISTYSEKFLNRYETPAQIYQARWKFDREPVYWNRQTLKQSLVTKTFDEYMNDDKHFKDLLMSLYSNGLAFIKDVPEGEKHNGEIAVEKIAKRIGYIKETFYGRSWNVVSGDQAKNIAYTSVVLPLHMDLLYYESPPGIQLLHCIVNNAEGGESVYVDSFRAAYLILQRDPAAFDILTKFPITFQYCNDGQHYTYTRPLIDIDQNYSKFDHAMPEQLIKNVNYSPPFQAPFEHGIWSSEAATDDLELSKFLHAFRQFEKILNDPVEQYEEKFKPGICALFMNRRVLHSRREFNFPNRSQSAEKYRWLKGTYLDIDSFYSKLRIISGRCGL
ncbi:taurine catabolism dioxygenase TauD, TfdA family-domain-containing protein [Lipomyces japonicus]|uniref:taurine catabolism dioxygenase TauD, TfdA family-domain-containing protein n=1 Tax=Lipomyces japonicus TaxID=56871 RepID=UPI0034CDB10B